MSIKLPGAVYGKNLISPGKVARHFHWIKRHHEFPEAIFSLADKWCQRFQWINIGEGRHKPIALWIPVLEAPGGALLLHFADVGLDDRGRPGTLSLAIAWASEDVIRQNPKLREYFLVQAVRAESFLEAKDEPTIRIQLDSDIVELNKTLSGRPNNIPIIASAASCGFLLQGLEKLLFLDANTWREQKESADLQKTFKRPSPSRLTEQKTPIKNATSVEMVKRKRLWGWLGIVISLLVLLVLAEYKLWEQQRSCDQLIRENNVLNGRCSDIEKEKQNLSQTLNDLQTEVAELKATLVKKDSEIESMQQNLPNATQKQIQELKKKCEEYLSVINNIKEIVSNH